jgi:hypothetical protein
MIGFNTQVIFFFWAFFFLKCFYFNITFGCRMLVIDLEVIAKSSFVEHFIFNGQDIMFVQIHVGHRVFLYVQMLYIMSFLAQVGHRSSCTWPRLHSPERIAFGRFSQRMCTKLTSSFVWSGKVSW